MLTPQRCRGMFLATALILGPVGGLAHPLPLAPEGPPPAIRLASGHPDEPALAPEPNPLVTRSLAQGWAIGTPQSCSALHAAMPISNSVLKKIADVIPHKCDDQIWGRWLCGERYYYDDPELPVGVGITIAFSSDVTPERFERIRFQVEPKGWGSRTDVFYTVDRQWRPDPMNKSMMKSVSCNKTSPFGKKIMAFYHKKSNGSKEGRGWIDYYMTSDPNLMEMKVYKYQPQPSGVEGKLLSSSVCERLSQ